MSTSASTGCANECPAPPAGLAWRVHATHVHAWVVIQHGADAGQYRPSTGPPLTPVQTRSLAGDPLAVAIVQSRAPVQTAGHLHANPRAACAPCARKTRCYPARPVRPIRRGVPAHPPECLPLASVAHPGLPPGVGVEQGHHHAGHPAWIKPISTGRGSTKMGTWLQGDVSRRAFQRLATLPRIAHGHDFGVGPARFLRVPGPHQSPLLPQRAAHGGVGWTQPLRTSPQSSAKARAWRSNGVGANASAGKVMLRSSHHCN